MAAQPGIAEVEGYRDDRLQRERRDDRERGMGRKSHCRDYDGMFF